MYTIYTSKGREIKTVATVEFWGSAIEIAERETKYGCNDQVWIEGPDGEVYN